MREMSEAGTQEQEAEERSTSGTSRSIFGTGCSTFGSDDVVEIDLLSDEAGPEKLTEQDVRILLGIPRSDRYGFGPEGGF
jgi:hypothetical protein